MKAYTLLPLFLISSLFGNQELDKKLFVAVKDKKLDLFKQLLKQGAKINAKSWDGITVLHEAARDGSFEIVQYCIKNFGTKIDTLDSDRRTPLHHAAIGGHLQIAQYLAEKQKSWLTARDQHGNTPAHYAAQEGKLEVLKYLVTCPQVNVDELNSHSNTLLDLATQKGHLSVVQYLIEERKATFQNKSLLTPVHLAVFGNNLVLLKYLVENRKMNIYEKRADGFTPLHLAVEKGCIEIVKYLVRKYREQKISINQKTEGGFTPLHVAVRKNHVALVHHLISCNAQVTEDIINGAKESSIKTLLSAVMEWEALRKNAQPKISQETLTALTQNPSLFVPLIIRPSLTVYVIHELIKNPEALRKIVVAFFENADSEVYNKEQIDQCAATLYRILVVEHQGKYKYIWDKGREAGRKKAPLFSIRWVQNKRGAQLLKNLQKNRLPDVRIITHE